jgi:hypothetical protein
MDEGAFQQPTPNQLAAFVEGDPIAEEEVLRLVLPQLTRWAVSQHPDLPPEEVTSLIYQVAAETCRPIVRYDPTKSKLTTYLVNLFKWRVKDLYRREAWIKRQAELDDESRENLPQSPYNMSNTPDPTRIIRDQFFQEAARDMNEVEREFLELMRQGEKSDAVYAEILVRHGSTADLSRKVKNLKVRLQRRLHRFAQQTGYELSDLLDG